MSNPILGIDLGTTNSVVAIADGAEVRALADEMGRRLIPSTVSFHPDGSILVGHDARDRRLVDAQNPVFSTKRLIGRPFSSVEVKRASERLPFALEPTPTGGVQIKVRRGTYTLPEISAFILRHVRTIAEQSLGTSCRRSVITVPANFNELQRSATQAAAKIAGLEVVRMINEPTAATLAYGLGKDGAERVLVYDLGGGTFDVTVLDLDRDALEVVSTAGDTFLGGDDFDQLLAERMADTCLRQHRFDPRSDVQTFERLRAAAEWAKCQLSVVPEVELAVEELFHEAGGRAVNFVFQARRADLEQLIRPLVSRTFDVVNEALRACGRRPKEIDTVVLVGGSTRVPMIMQMVGEFFGRQPRFERDPDLVVAQGAALQAYTLAGQVEARAAGPRPPVPRPLAPARPREPLPKQPAFAPAEPSRTVKEPSRLAPLPTAKEISRSGKEVSRTVPEPSRPHTDPGLGRPGTEPGVGTRKSATSPGLSSATGTAIARVQLKNRGDDRQARAIETPDAAPPPASRRLSQPGVTSREPTLRTQNDPTGSPVPRERELASVAVVKPVSVGTQSRPITLNELDSVEAAPPPPSMTAPLERKARKQTIVGGMAPLPMTGKLGADDPFDLGSKETTLPSLAEFDEEPTRVGKAPEPQRPAPPPAPPAPPARAKTAELGELPLPPAPEPARARAPEPRPLPPEPPRPAPRIEPEPPSRPLPRAEPEPAPRVARTTGSIKRDISAWSPEPPSSPSIALPLAPEPPSLPAMFVEPSAPANVVPGVPYQPAIPMPKGRAPLLMDVTPLALGIETVGGYCQHLVNRNAPVPTEKTRVFATGRDEQTSVEIRICQGDSNVFGENEALGVISLDALRRAKRGDVRIEVTFVLDASGVLDVRRPISNTKRAQVTRIQLRGGLAPGEVDSLRARQERELGGRA